MIANQDSNTRLMDITVLDAICGHPPVHTVQRKMFFLGFSVMRELESAQH